MVTAEHKIFLSTPSARRATDFLTPELLRTLFLSTPSVRRATISPLQCASGMRYFYPRPPREGRQSILAEVPQWSDISIHTLREEGDCRWHLRPCFLENFYPRPPRGGRPYFLGEMTALVHISIHALREEGDQIHQFPPGQVQHFYPRPPRGGRQSGAVLPRRGSPFLSTPSARRATDRRYHNGRNFQDFYPRPPRGGRRTIPVFSPGA